MTASLRIHPVSTDSADWIDLWKAAGARLPLHPDWVRLATFPGAPPSVGLGGWRGNDLVSVLPFIVQHRHGLVRWISPLQCSSAGLLLRPGVDATGVLHAYARAMPSSVDHAEIVFPSGVEDLRPFAWAGWTVRPHYNFVTQWAPDGEWEASFDPTVRRQIRKAANAGLRTTFDDLAAAELATLYVETMERHGIPPTGRLEPMPFIEWVLGIGGGFIAAVRDAEGSLDCAALITTDTAGAAYAIGASCKGATGTGGGSMLQRDILLEIERRGMPRRYDWVGANTPSIAQFKKKFGPRLETGFLAEYQSRKGRLISGIKKTLSPG